jgi:hypothetical protein
MSVGWAEGVKRLAHMDAGDETDYSFSTKSTVSPQDDSRI